ncbi:NAD(+) diphosphatase [Flavimaricola marinus]|uniref:NAD(+) diphosphatase n=1 Tax=Flavimaricola marinus TaxID=1819565 RepID=A0A238LCU8_9RHOB|nr:NAD(+) diphosphatase [Flavimaricola marinus]SMY06740.1 NADH pyrophosphatase [Flavimaricola marinus]
MKNAETVTFGGSALERRAELRGDALALADLAARPGAGMIPLWRGKPLVAGGEDALSIARLPHGHPVFDEARDPPIFLGVEDGEGVWARDISAWEPEDVDLASLGLFLDPTEQRHPDLGGDERFAELRAIMTRITPRDAELAATAKAVLGWHDSHRFCARCGHASEVAMAGWQRDCPACGTHHFPRTDPVVIMLVTSGDEVLLGRSPGWPEGMFSLLAGFIEPGEPIEAAVRREVFEESGVRVGAVSYLASQPWPFPASLMFGCHGHAETREITVDPTEIEQALWVSKDRLARIFNNEDPEIRPARKGAIAHFILWNWLEDQLD